MKIRVFNLPFSSSEGGFDDGDLVEFVDAHQVISCSDHFFVDGGIPHLAIVVAYRDDGIVVRQSDRGRKNENPREKLGDEEREVYDRLRSWRRAAAARDGIPVFLVATNKELAAIVLRRPTNKSELMSVEGIGPGKLERYGTELLALLSGKGAEE